MTPDEIQCLFSAEIRQQNGSYLIEIPERELTLGALNENNVYRVAVLSSTTETDQQAASTLQATNDDPEPPVEEGTVRDVEIESKGDQGDGVARIGPGYVIFVPDTEIGDQVTVEITNVQPQFAFGEVVEGLA